jgi:multidrug efflux pump subunit AcrB
MLIVQPALRRPYTFLVAFVLLLLTPFILRRTPTDIFPSINLPAVSTVRQSAGLPAKDLAQRMVCKNERSFTTTANNLQPLEQQIFAAR